MLAALGMFVFDISSLAFEELARRRAWRHARTDRFSALAASQFVGPGDDQITLSGALVPELGGRYSSIEQIAAMADTGEAYPLADGTGRVFGTFTIEGLDETHKYLVEGGVARKVEFSITLQRVADQ